jgi:glucosamine-phosphate N-acetyltransferase
MSHLLFSQSFISAALQSQLPTGLHLRPLSEQDYEKGFLEALSHLTSVRDNFQKGTWIERFNYMRQHNYEYFVIVVEDTTNNEIAASGTNFIERKFVHRNGLVGHFEDNVVHEDYREPKLGTLIIDQLKHIRRSQGAHKVILDCDEKNIAF